MGCPGGFWRVLLLSIVLGLKDIGFAASGICEFEQTKNMDGGKSQDFAGVLAGVGDDIEPISGAIAHDLDEAARILSGLGVTQNAQ